MSWRLSCGQVRVQVQVCLRERLLEGLIYFVMVLAQDPARFTQDTFSASFSGSMVPASLYWPK